MKNLAWLILAVAVPNASALASDPEWNLLYERQQDDNLCFYSASERPSAVLSNRNTMETKGRKSVPMATLASGEKIELPKCSAALFAGEKPGEYYAISNTSVHRRELGAFKRYRWKTLIDYKEKMLGMTGVRMAFNPKDQVVAWVGHSGTSNGMNYNYMIVWDLKEKKRTATEIGGGYNGMSGVQFDEKNGRIIVARADWCAGVTAYDYAAKEIRNFDGINGQFSKERYCLGLNHRWLWNVDFGRDRSTGEYLFNFSMANNEKHPHPKYGAVFRLDLEKDVIVEATQE